MRKRGNAITRGIQPMAGAAFALAVLAGVSFLNAAEPFRALKGPDIRSRLTGMEFTDEVHWALVFGRDGTLASVSMGKQTSGRWRVKQDQLCLDRSANDQRCYAVSRSGKTYRLQEPGFDIYEEGIVQRPSARH